MKGSWPACEVLGFLEQGLLHNMQYCMQITQEVHMEIHMEKIHTIVHKNTLNIRRARM